MLRVNNRGIIGVEQATLVFQKDRRGMEAQRRVGDKGHEATFPLFAIQRVFESGYWMLSSCTQVLVSSRLLVRVWVGNKKFVNNYEDDIQLFVEGS